MQELTGRAIYKSSDGGTTWHLSVYAGTLGGGVYRSVGGGTWTAMNQGLTNLSVIALAMIRPIQTDLSFRRSWRVPWPGRPG